MKQKKVEDDYFGRVLEWPLCPVCEIPARTLIPSFAGQTCVQCHFIDVVRREVRSLSEVIQNLRDLGLCAYCGEHGAEVEHVIPRRAHLATFTVPACRECNGIASGKLFESFNEKQQHIRKGLRKKYDKVLRIPQWDAEEIADLGRAMQDMVKKWEAARLIMVQRLSWEPTIAARDEDEN